MRRRVVAGWAVVLFCLAGSASAQTSNVGAPPADRAATSNEVAAREAFERGRVFYDGGQFEEAAVAFEEAYRLSDRAALLYNLYLAHRDANDQEKAAEALRGFLTRVENIENRAQLEARLVALEQGIAREREQRTQHEARESAPAPSPVASTEAPVEPQREGRSMRFYAGIGLAGVGAALMASSLITGLLSKQRADKLKDECVDKQCAPELKATQESGERLALTTDALLFGGLAVAAAGTVLLVLELRKSPDSRARATPQVDASCTRAGCTAFASLRF
jgi:tetratricopeptide (TPR) repeat protein